MANAGSGSAPMTAPGSCNCIAGRGPAQPSRSRRRSTSSPPTPARSMPRLAIGVLPPWASSTARATAGFGRCCARAIRYGSGSPPGTLRWARRARAIPACWMPHCKGAWHCCWMSSKRGRRCCCPRGWPNACGSTTSPRRCRCGSAAPDAQRAAIASIWRCSTTMAGAARPCASCHSKRCPPVAGSCARGNGAMPKRLRQRIRRRCPAWR